ncbi:MAG: hypothetical protein MMC33_006729 [Icmadophila ericetorum]|nr:hypothetical protein [Icmadophila ericetorum]
MLTQEGGYTQQLITAMINLVPGFGNLATERTVPALAAIYFFVAFIGSSSLSAAGLAATTKEMDLNHPRAQQASLSGLPLRLKSAHLNMVENFPAFALSAALVHTIAPTNQHLINLLGFFVLNKTFVYWPAYVTNVAPARSASHLVSMASLLQVFYLLAKDGGK